VGSVSSFFLFVLLLSCTTYEHCSDSKDLLEGPTVVPLEKRSQSHRKRNQHCVEKCSLRARKRLPLTPSLSSLLASERRLWHGCVLFLSFCTKLSFLNFFLFRLTTSLESTRINHRRRSIHRRRKRTEQTVDLQRCVSFPYIILHLFTHLIYTG
jgi:hypothetical protein